MNDVKMLKWAAVAVTVLFALLNLGTVPDSSQSEGMRLLGAVLGVAGVAAAALLATDRPWGRPAVVAVGALNGVAAIVSLAVEGSSAASTTGVVLGVICIALGALAPQGVSSASAGPSTTTGRG